MKPLIRLLAICCFIALACGVRADATASAEYVLGPDDVIDITVANHSDLNKTLTVLPDGKISFPEVGTLQAAGKTPTALAAELQTELEKSLNNANVTISVKEVHSKKVRITGTAIKSAGSYDLKNGYRLMDIIAMAGGLSTSKPTRVSGRIFRSNAAVIPLNLVEATEKPDSEANIKLEADDLVLLDEIDIHNQVHVIGQVNKPGAYDLDENLNIVRLISEANGPTDKAALRQAYILRGNTQFPMNLFAVLEEGKTDETVTGFKLQPGDVLFIPEIERRFGVMGQVSKPGYYPFSEKEEMTVLKALGAAGGQLPDADLKHAGIIRTVNGKAEMTKINIEDMLKKGKMTSNITLQPEDVLVIPPRGHKGANWLDILYPLEIFNLFGIRLGR